MNICLAGDDNRLTHSLRSTLAAQGHQVYDASEINGCDLVLSTLRDEKRNNALLEEAKKAGRPHFAYVSMLHASSAPEIPVLNACRLSEDAVLSSGLSYTIYRPAPLFDEVIDGFLRLMEEKKLPWPGKASSRTNPVHIPELSAFISDTMTEENHFYAVGGAETWSFEEIARLCFAAVGKEPNIQHLPEVVYDAMCLLPQNKKTGRDAQLRLARWAFTTELVGDMKVGEESLEMYIRDRLNGWDRL